MPAMRRAVHHAKQLVSRRVRPVALLGVALAGLAGAPAVHAFGPSGHRTAGHLADLHLCAATRHALVPLLAGMTLAEAGVWPDTIRRQPAWEHTRPWHFINVADRGSIARAARQGPDNVLAALARFEKELADRSLTNRQRGIALRFVAHFVVDLHQPLHVGRAEDRGGNLIPVLAEGRETNLHALWDGESLQDQAAGGPRARARSLPRPRAADVTAWQAASPLDWARESRDLRPRVYGFGPGGPPVVLTPAYLADARATVDRRLVEAGVRLAGRLNALVGPGAGCPG